MISQQKERKVKKLNIDHRITSLRMKLPLIMNINTFLMIPRISRRILIQPMKRNFEHYLLMKFSLIPMISKRALNFPMKLNIGHLMLMTIPLISKMSLRTLLLTKMKSIYHCTKFLIIQRISWRILIQKIKKNTEHFLMMKSSINSKISKRTLILLLKLYIDH